MEHVCFGSKDGVLARFEDVRSTPKKQTSLLRRNKSAKCQERTCSPVTNTCSMLVLELFAFPQVAALMLNFISLVPKLVNLEGDNQ